jgi:hypothetical protein
MSRTKPRWPEIVSTLVTILLLVGVSAACVRSWHHGRNSNETTDTPEISSQPPSAVEPLDTAQCGTATATSTAELTNITSGRHDTFDRIVLTFVGPEPACSAGYVNQIVADGSGQPISLDGNAFLQVTLREAAAHNDAGRLTYNGPRMIDTPELENITAVTLAGDFEGSVTIGLGMNMKAHYEVFALSGPTRVVIDVGH